MALVIGDAQYIRQRLITTATPADGDMLIYRSATGYWVTAASPLVIERDDIDCGSFIDTPTETLDLGSFV